MKHEIILARGHRLRLKLHHGVLGGFLRLGVPVVLGHVLVADGLAFAKCDGLGGPSTYDIPGSFNDGKGEPGQSNAVSHGCPVARFRQINVLNTASAPIAGQMEDDH